jgi:hypothetical protein
MAESNRSANNYHFCEFDVRRDFPILDLIAPFARSAGPAAGALFLVRLFMKSRVEGLP